MIERDGFNGPIIFRCDGDKCHEYEETHCENFSGANAKVKSHGWTNVRRNNEWINLCPECSE